MDLSDFMDNGMAIKAVWVYLCMRKRLISIADISWTRIWYRLLKSPFIFLIVLNPLVH